MLAPTGTATRSAQALPAALAAKPLRAASSPAQTHGVHLARVEIFASFCAASSLWTAIVSQGWLATPFQDFRFLRSWFDNLGRREGASPLVVVGYDAEHRPVVLLPFVLQRCHGANVARFAGGKHATFNMGLWRPDYAAATAPC